MTPLIDSLDLDATHLALAENRAMLGISHSAIAKELNTNTESLELACGPRLAAARHQSNLRVLEAMHTMATSGKSYSATLLWIKTHCGDLWSLSSPKEPKENTWNPNNRSSFEIEVYNNDGEPNFRD